VSNLTRHAIDSRRWYYTADVTNGGDVTALSSRWGSWMTPDARREAKPLVAAMLQREVGNKERVARGAPWCSTDSASRPGPDDDDVVGDEKRET
jgi:hypothetical protein